METVLVLLAASLAAALWSLGRARGALRRTGADATAARGELASVREELADVSERLRVLFDNAPDAFFWYDLRGVLVEGNRAATELVGYRREELVGNSILELGILAPHDVVRAAEVIAGAVRGEVASPREWLFHRKDGSRVWVEIRSFPATMAGQPVILVMATDLTGRKQAEDFATGLGHMLEESLNEVYVFDADSLEFLLVNRGARENLGYTESEFEALRATDLLPADLRPRLGELLARVTALPSQAAHARIRLRRKDASVYPVEVYLHRATLRDRSVFEAFVLDVTEIERTIEELRESERRLSEAQRVARLGHWIWDVATNSLEWSDTVFDIVGRDRTEFDGTLEAWLRFVHPEDRELVERMGTDLVRFGGKHQFDHRIVTADGEIRFVHESGELETTAGGTRAIGTVLDITARKQAEQDLIALNQQLEARVADRTAELRRAVDEVESFSYAISHDLRQPLRAVDGYVRFLEEEAGPGLDEEARGYVRRILFTVGRMSAMIDAMLQLSRLGRAELSFHPTDLSAMAASVVREIAEAHPDREISWEIEPGMTASCDARLVEMLLANLLGNAEKFTRGRDDARISLTSRHEGGETVYAVADNGVGFDMGLAAKLFGPFQRLHRMDEFPGNGVGLATCERVVTRHGGRLWAEAAPGKGATFRFTLGPAERGAVADAS